MEAQQPPPQSKSKYLFYGLTAVTVSSTLFLLPFIVTPALPRKLYGALPYQNTPSKHIKTALKLINNRIATNPPPNPTSLPPKKLKFVDLGSGAGEATILASFSNFDALGVEINPSLLLYSRAASVVSRSPCRFKSLNLINLPFQDYDVLFMFGVKPLIEQLKPKLISEVRIGGLVCLYRFKLTSMDEHFEVVGREGEVTIYERTSKRT
ncbi:hypothetical protein TrST_g785 [Triparma strigata]|uniref:Methyltransferase domain-containing protein n=1 Tax=Triparma strigata TaxID=1606541 RepID=A0A9W7AH74_9STRA|nr:hypothetical protein TrST_g785 [Triparma strigata]